VVGAIIRRNVATSVLLKGGTLLLQLATLPILFHALGGADYGIWATMQSIIVWFTLFDFGITLGLRNRLTAALAREETDAALEYISTAFLVQGVLWFGVVLISGLIVFAGGVPWASWFRSDSSDLQIGKGLWYCLTTLAVSQWLGCVNSILCAKHWNSLTAIPSLASNGLILLWVIVARWNGLVLTIEQLAWMQLVCMAVSYGIHSILVFRNDLKLLPRVSHVSRHRFSEISTLGGQFLLLQLAHVAIATTDRWVVLRYLGPEAAGEYDVLFRLFAIITTGHALLVAPMWALSGAAWARGNAVELQKLFRITAGWSGLGLMGVLVMGVLFRPLVSVWIDPKLSYGTPLILSYMICAVLVIWNGGVSTLLNGAGRVREQTWVCLLSTAINLPLSILFCSTFGWGMLGVVIASCIALLCYSVVGWWVWQSLMHEATTIERHPSSGGIG
jgi:O-antigen/teichoic acid export membrane protein